MRSKYVKSILIGTLASIAFTTNAYAFAVQPDGYVDQSFVEAANDQLDLLPDYLIDAMEDDGLNIYITDKNIDSYFSAAITVLSWGLQTLMVTDIPISTSKTGRKQCPMPLSMK